jgi:hypothetical protein
MRWHDDRTDLALADDVSETLAVKLAARSQGFGEFCMTDKGRLILEKSASAEGMIWVDMAQDDIFDGLVGLFSYDFAQPLPVGETSATVRDHHGIVTDDEADIGDRVEIGGARIFIDPVAHENAWRYLGNVKGSGIPECWQAAEAQASSERLPA